jgi:hypothetical protein
MNEPDDDAEDAALLSDYRRAVEACWERTKGEGIRLALSSGDVP